MAMVACHHPYNGTDGELAMGPHYKVSELSHVGLNDDCYIELELTRTADRMLLTPDQARRLADRLIELAEELDGFNYSEWKKLRYY
jgi:hypothetical protein